MQCGHLVPRQYLATRFDELNCACQCYACNMLYNGQGATFAIRLDQKHGIGTVARLEALRWKPVKLDEIWYEEKYQYYLNKIND